MIELFVILTVIFLLYRATLLMMDFSFFITMKVLDIIFLFTKYRIKNAKNNRV